MHEIGIPSFISDEEFTRIQGTYTLERILSSDCHAVDLYTQLLNEVIALSQN